MYKKDQPILQRLLDIRGKYLGEVNQASVAPSSPTGSSSVLVIQQVGKT